MELQSWFLVEHWSIWIDNELLLQENILLPKHEDKLPLKQMTALTYLRMYE